MVEQEHASWLWERLSLALPRAHSCVLMPEHLHTVAPPGGGEGFRRVLTGYTRRYGVRFDIEDPEPGNSPAIVMRQIRYGYFNPQRAGLIQDPWCWRWSTLRDLGGACHPVWTDLGSVASVLRLPPRQALHQLTTVADCAAPPLRAPTVAVASIGAVVGATAAALRCSEEEVAGRVAGRRLVVQACYEIGMPNPAEIAAALGCSVRTVHRARQPREPGLDAVLTCLADPRLTWPTPR